MLFSITAGNSYGSGKKLNEIVDAAHVEAVVAHAVDDLVQLLARAVGVARGDREQHAVAGGLGFAPNQLELADRKSVV